MAVTGKTVTQAGPPNTQQLIADGIRDLDVDRKAGMEGVQNRPPTNSTVLDANQQEIVGYFATKLRQRKSDCETRLQKFAHDRGATASKIDIEQTRHSFARILNAVEPGLERLRQEHADVLREAKINEERALRYLRLFQQEHGLFRRAATYPESLLWHFAVVAAIAVFEWISLSSFYAEGSDFGLLGGILIAMALSIANVSLALIAGNILRYLNHKSQTRKSLALAGVGFLAVCFFIVTLGAAHYRTATNEIAQLQQAALQQRPGAATGKGAMMMPSDADQWRAAKLAWQRFRENPIGFEDVFSVVLIILAVIFGIFAAYKGYMMDDAYPDYGQHDRDFKKMKTIYEAKKQGYALAVDQFFERTLQEQSRLLSDARANIDYYQQLASRTIDEVRAFPREAAEIQDAGNIVVFNYRQKNTEVATAPRPDYFGKPISLDDRLMIPPKGLSPEEEELQKRYENAMREFSDIAQTNNGRVQSLRTAEIKRLEAYFEGVERDVREKLRHEEEEIPGAVRGQSDTGR